MTRTAIAIFVKTPGLSPTKSRLARLTTPAIADEFHRRAVEIIEAVVAGAGSAFAPYWAVAEAEGMGHAWWGRFDRMWQGEGDRGQRFDRVYTTLLEQHRRVLLVGADCPLVTTSRLRQAERFLFTNESPFVMGPAKDGGFWLFGGRNPIPSSVWTGVQYDSPETGKQLMSRMAEVGRVRRLPELRDVDDATDLYALPAVAPQEPVLLPLQRELLAWISALSRGRARG